MEEMSSHVRPECTALASGSVPPPLPVPGCLTHTPKTPTLGSPSGAGPTEDPFRQHEFAWGLLRAWRPSKGWMDPRASALLPGLLHTLR